MSQSIFTRMPAIQPDASARFSSATSAMFLKEPNTALELLAPVQVTPFITGIFGTPGGEDANGRKPGGGGVNTFGFNSAYVPSSSAATVAQTRQWSLTDAVGTSSAFFAEVLQNLFQGWRQNPADLAALVAVNADTIEHWIRTKLPIEARGPAADLLRLNAQPMLGQPLLQTMLSDLQKIIPSYQYWPVLDPRPSAQPIPSQFADGGNLENTGIAALLAYSDIDNIIAFINPMTVMQPGPYGVADGQGGFIPGTTLIVDACIPPLFGYQPYSRAAWARAWATSATARVRPTSIRCMPTTRSSRPPPFRLCCKDFGRRVAAGVTRALPSSRSGLQSDQTRGSA